MSSRKVDGETLDLFAVESLPPAAPPPSPSSSPAATGLPVSHAAMRQEEPASFAPPHAAMQHTAPRAGATPSEEVGGGKVFRVSEIVRLAGRHLESRFADVWIEGEVSNLRTPGHVYFTLKDAEAQLPAVLWKSDAARLRFRLVDGLQIRARGRLSIYDAQGKFQLYVETVEPAGLGALQLAFEQLKRKLEDEGLFTTQRKRPLPFYPRCLGVATSATGAAVRDIIRVAQRRGPVRILIAPCQVQGEAAPDDIVRALLRLQAQPEVEVIILGRGGGSIEDLWAFNDERVARAIAACRVPVISAVGHEVDFTIADFVADRRAATPSQAAELAVPVHADLVTQLEAVGLRLHQAGRHVTDGARQRLDEEARRALALLQCSIGIRRRRMDEQDRRLAMLHPRAQLLRRRNLLEKWTLQLEPLWRERWLRGRRALEEGGQRSHAAMQQARQRRRAAFETVVGKLDALSPLRVLERGYSVIRSTSGRVVSRASQALTGDELNVRLCQGSLSVCVLASDEGEPPSSSSPPPAEACPGRPSGRLPPGKKRGED